MAVERSRAGAADERRERRHCLAGVVKNDGVCPLFDRDDETARLAPSSAPTDGTTSAPITWKTVRAETRDQSVHCFAPMFRAARQSDTTLADPAGGGSGVSVSTSSDRTFADVARHG